MRFASMLSRAVASFHIARPDSMELRIDPFLDTFEAIRITPCCSAASRAAATARLPAADGSNMKTAGNALLPS
jgi:hypothetical protein